MIVLETKRLLLRRLEMGDLDDLFALYSDPEVTRFIPDSPLTLAETREQLEWFLHGHLRYPELGLWATIHKESGAFIGRSGLLPWEVNGRSEVEVAYMIAKPYWGQGLGTEVAQAIRDYGFGTLGLTRLVCLISHGHVASMRVAEKIGMVFETEGEDEIGPFLLYSQNKLV